MLGVEARAGFRVARRDSGDARAPGRAQMPIPEVRGAGMDLVAGDALAVCDHVEYTCGAGDGVGVVPGREIGVQRMVSAPERLE